MQPIVAFFPERSLLHKNRLFLSICLPRSQVRARNTDGAEQPTPNEKVQQQKNQARHREREQALAPVHPLKPCCQELHFGFPSNRNWAWSLGKIRGAAISKRKICSPGFFFTLSENW